MQQKQHKKVKANKKNCRLRRSFLKLNLWTPFLIFSFSVEKKCRNAGPECRFGITLTCSFYHSYCSLCCEMTFSVQSTFDGMNILQVFNFFFLPFSFECIWPVNIKWPLVCSLSASLIFTLLTRVLLINNTFYQLQYCEKFLVDVTCTLNCKRIQASCL